MTHKLTYEIVGRHEEVVPGVSSTLGGGAMEDIEIDVYEVEWRHADGPITDTVLLPTLDFFEKKWLDHRGDEQIDFLQVRGEREAKAGIRSVIKDTVRVKKGSPRSLVHQLLEEKRARIAANLRIEA